MQGFRSTLSLLVAGGLLLTAGPVLAEDVPAPTADAKPVDCIQLTRINRSEVLDDQTIVFHGHGRQMWKNVFPHRCPGLGFEKRFLFKTSLSQICSVDTITVLNSFGGGMMPGASCGLGAFVPIDKAGYDALKKQIKDARAAKKAARKAD